MRKFLIMIIALLVSGLVLSAGTDAATFNVNVQNFFFQPDPIVINVGDTVTWTNNSGVFHTTTSGTNCNGDGIWNGSLSGSGGTFSRTFDTPGTFPYFCVPHCSAGMTGTIVVNAVAIPAPVGAQFAILQPIAEPVIGSSFATSSPIGLGQFAVGGATLDLTIGLGRYSAPVDLYLAISASTIPNTIIFLLPDLSLVSLTFDQVVQAFTTGVLPANVLPWMANVSTQIDSTIFAGVPAADLGVATYGVYLLVVPQAGTLANYDLYVTAFTSP